MKIRFYISSLLCFLSFILVAQPFNEAPKVSAGKVKMITEWVRPNLKAKSTKGSVSQFNAKGKLVSYAHGRDSSVYFTTFQYDKAGRLETLREGSHTDGRVTRYTYAKGREVEEMSFRGKRYRKLSFFNKKGQLQEVKTYGKGGELGPKYLIKERILYHYDATDSLKAEKILTYNLPGAKKFESRKVTYAYHPESKYLIKKVAYDYDGKVAVVTDYTYYPNKKPKSELVYYKGENLLESKEYLYQDGKLWQEISTENGFRHIKVFTNGRLIRMRSYLGNEIYRVVDYQWEYY